MLKPEILYAQKEEQPEKTLLALAPFGGEELEGTTEKRPGIRQFAEYASFLSYLFYTKQVLIMLIIKGNYNLIGRFWGKSVDVSIAVILLTKLFS